ncbi:hypothetical protein [Streptomyces atroolivaceus]
MTSLPRGYTLIEERALVETAADLMRGAGLPDLRVEPAAAAVPTA